MEEILASIRRIIADDQSLPGRGPTPFPEAEARATDDLVAERQRDEQRQEDRSRDERTREERVRDQATREQPTRVPPPRETSTRELHVRGERARDEPVRRVGAVHGSSSDADRLPPQPSATRGAQAYDSPGADDNEPLYDTPIEPTRPPEPVREKSPLFSAATDSAVSAAFNMLAASRLANNSDEIMTLARDMIRPLLRTWIDENLPSMVERMVRAEIERVARGGS
jgi:cell pole-organizing protein PopZ